MSRRHIYKKEVVNVSYKAEFAKLFKLQKGCCNMQIKPSTTNANSNNFQSCTITDSYTSINLQLLIACAI